MMAAILTRDTVISAEDYISAQQRCGVFGEDAAAPENDPRVLRAYMEFLKTHYPDESDFAVKILAGRYGFFLDPVDNARDGLNWAMTTPIIDLCIGVTFEQFINDLPSLRAEAAEAILTDTFSFTDGFGDLSAPLPGLVRLNSPVADIAMPFSAYLESLTSERRKKYRRMVSDFEKTPLSFSLSQNCLTAAETDFIRTNLERKWGDDAGYAYRQTLWFLSVQKIRPAQCLVMRVTDGNDLVFIQTMIARGGHVTCQSIAKCEDRFYNGLAAFTDFACVEKLCGPKDYAVFDPSCRTSLSDPESIGVAKRATVNKNCIKPLLAIGVDFNDDIRNAIADSGVHGREA